MAGHQDDTTIFTNTPWFCLVGWCVRCFTILLQFPKLASNVTREWLCTVNWKGKGRNCGLLLGYYPSIHLEWLRRITKSVGWLVWLGSEHSTSQIYHFVAYHRTYGDQRELAYQEYRFSVVEKSFILFIIWWSESQSLVTGIINQCFALTIKSLSTNPSSPSFKTFVIISSKSFGS
jgi:hypothetical protein